MIPFERQFQTLHSLQNYLHLNELLAPGWPMPIVDTEELRLRRAAFLERFCTRPYYLIRAAILRGPPITWPCEMTGDGDVDEDDLTAAERAAAGR